jgi:uncharacterized protein YndB with AHSA1/START domain
MTPDTPADDAIRRTFTVPATPDRAFALFTDELATWWPPEYTWSQGLLETIAIEPRAGGLCSERGPHGFRIDWGRVLTWSPPERLVFTWQISPERVPEPDPSRASEVEVRFAPDGTERTRVELEHRAFARHGEGADAYRGGMEGGWDHLVARFTAAAA